MVNFTVQKGMFGNFEEYTIKNRKTLESVKIVSGFGCNIRELILKQGIHLHSVIKGHVIPSKLKKKFSTGAMLSPFTGRIPEGIYKFSGTKQTLKINKPSENVAIHGLVYDKEFSHLETEISQDHASISFELEISENTLCGYPFSLKLVKKITLSDKGLEVKTMATNTGTTDLPFGDGWHPYFVLSGATSVIDEYVLELQAKSIFRNNTKKIVTSKQKLPKQSKLNPGNGVLSSRVFDNCYTDIKRTKDGIGEACLYSNQLKLVLWFDKSYSFVQIYTPDDRKSVAIEPMTCPSNSFNNEIGLRIIKPGRMFEGNYGVYLVEQ